MLTAVLWFILSALLFVFKVFLSLVALALVVIIWAMIEEGTWRELFLPERRKGPPGRRR